MKSTKNLLVAALAAGGLVMAGSAFAQHSGHSGGGHWSGGHSSGGHFSGGHFNGGHFRGGHFRGGHFFGPRFSFFLGVPLFWGSYYWGSPYYYPYYDGYYAPDAPVVYQEREVVPYDAAPTTEAAPGPGAPSQGPLYMNYCASARAYYPKVTQCPEGWKFIAPSR
jgi:hypothetical protein